MNSVENTDSGAAGAERSTRRIVAGVLAGERSRASSIAEAESVSTKVVVDIAGRPMLERVLGTVAEVVSAPVLLCGPDEALVGEQPWLVSLRAAERVRWLPPAPSPSASARAVCEAARALDPEAATLVTTGDHPLLTASTLARFLDDALDTGADVVVGLAPIEVVRSGFPDSRRTVLGFAGQGFCGCNLFFFRGPRVDGLLDFWSRIEQFRKQPHRMLGALGPLLVARYLAGRLAIEDALEALSAKTGARVAHVRVLDPDAAVDVDSLEDLATVRARFAQRAVQAGRGAEK